MVSSRHWPLISRYRAAVRTQSPKVEMIDSLYKRISETEDDGIMRLDIFSFKRRLLDSPPPQKKKEAIFLMVSGLLTSEVHFPF